MSNNVNLERIALLYRDLLSSTIKSLPSKDKDLLLTLQPTNKIVAIGDIDFSNWNAYPLTWLLDRKLVAPTVLDDSKIYQSMHGMRTHNEKVAHPQTLISESIVIRLLGLDNSPNINDYINSYINMCIASDECKVIFVVIHGNKKSYKDNVYIRKTNSTFIETSTGKPYIVESSPLCISPDQIVYFGHSKKQVTKQSLSVSQVTQTSNKNKNNSLSSMINDSDMF